MNKNKRNKILGLTISAGAVLAILGAVTIAANIQSNNLDLLLGRGEKHVESTGERKADYIDFKFDNQADALKNAQDKTRLTAEEGITLLKNEEKALPFDATSEKITILGYYSWHNNMSGGEDPASTKGAVSLGKGLEAKFKTNEAVNKLYSAPGVSGDFKNPEESLKEAESTFTEYSTAVITIKRNSGEGNDQSLNTGASENGRSGLVINTSELKLIDYASKHFKKVVVVINAANAMELGWLQEKNLDNEIYTDPYTGKKYDFSKVKAALWAGCCGSQGGTALANILSGEVTPSGHLVDTYVKDLRKDPTYQNFGSYAYENSDELNSYQEQTFFVDYEEGIYVGYRYYETAAKEAMNNNYAGFNYDNEVVYPFGYGISYTTFEQKLAETPTFDEKTNEFTFKVKVKNTGEYKGKSVAQIYVNVPYVKGGVEKAHVTLAGFEKTQLLNPGEEETLTIKFNRDYITSYDYEKAKCYILDKGDYNFYLSENAHSWSEIDQLDAAKKKDLLWTYHLDNEIVYDKSNKRTTDLTPAVNKEDDELNYKFKSHNEAEHGEGYAINFTRSDFKKSFPQKPQEDDFYMTDERALEQVAIYDVWKEENNPIKDMPDVNTDYTNYTLADMRGIAFDDPKWDDYINQFTVDKMAEMFMNGGWNEMGDEENGVPLSYDADSPYGYYAHALTIKDINKWYCGGPMLAATWNLEIAKEVGDAFGEEAHANQLAGGTLITGVYGYGLNMHRSAFGGRNYEYYSEDGVLSGKFAAVEASAASEKGLITFMKHYTLNDQETNRQLNGYCAYVNEQAFREVYLKGWEIYIKEAKMDVRYYKESANGVDKELSKTTLPAATGIMTAYNRIGATYAGASVSLHDILEDEFGYTGTTITDAGGQKDTYMTTDFLLRRGGHLTLTNNGTDGLYDKSSPTAIYHLKDATKHILYNKANSNCVQGIAPGDKIWYDLSPWRVGLYSAWGVVGALCAVDLVILGLIATNKIKIKEKPEVDQSTIEEF